jgi:hypothetical protein
MINSKINPVSKGGIFFEALLRFPLHSFLLFCHAELVEAQNNKKKNFYCKAIH